MKYNTKLFLTFSLLSAIARCLNAGIPETKYHCYAFSESGKQIIVDGIPFIQGALLVPAKEGAVAEVDAGRIKTRSIFVLGCVNSESRVNPDWGGSDSFRSFFIGDRIGTLFITYRSGRADKIPLILGYNVWWDAVYRNAPEPFRSGNEARKMLDKALYVAHGIELNKPLPYYIKIDVKGEPIAKISLADNVAKTGYFSVTGITAVGGYNNDSPAKSIWKPLDGGVVPAERIHWLLKHTISSANAYNSTQKYAVRQVERLLSIFPPDLNEKTIAITKPDPAASSFPGVKIKFGGGALAKVLNNIYLENAAQLLERVDNNNGMVHESADEADYYRGFGTWTPKLGAFYNYSYTRIRALILLSNMGFTERVDKALDHYDKWMLYYPHSFPKVQLNGKPVPMHASVIANSPHVYFDSLNRKVWPTKFKTRDFGNPENDGHGMLMLTSWHNWVKEGRKPQWINDRWEAISGAADYIQWALDNPELSFSQHGLLYSESEGGLGKESLYCDVPCYFGLLAYTEMAKAVGQTDKATQWTILADRLLKAINSYYPAHEPRWGTTWDATKAGEWVVSGNHSTMAPMLLGTDYFGYDPIKYLPADWAKITRNTYHRQLTKTDSPGVNGMGLGYGQSYLTEASLLMDDTRSAQKNVNWLARFCFSPRQPHPYRVPEGITIKPDGSSWRRWGDLGNLYQLGEVVHVIQIMAGIDDMRSDTVLLMPRLIPGISTMEVVNYPIRKLAGDEGRSSSLTINIQRNISAGTFNANINTGKPINIRFRVGPFRLTDKVADVSINKKHYYSKLVTIGDAKWAWLTLGDNATTQFNITSKAL